VPELFENFFHSLYTMPLTALALWTLLENVMIFVVCLVAGHFLVLRYQRHPVTVPPEPITTIEIVLAVSCVLLNALVTFIGAMLWRAGLITIDFSLDFSRVIVDSVVLFFVMDLGMYIFHRLAHHWMLYPLLHSTHHRYENPRPLTLFVLNPFEVLGFGVLWLSLLVIYPSNWLSVILYLTLNIVFGLVGHLGVEPMPNRWIKIPFIHYISTSTFHAEHHQDGGHNFGFYTLIWDQLFGTLSPDYETDFTSARAGKAIDA
jgi:Delta7-sterol 5-desaturase